MINRRAFLKGAGASVAIAATGATVAIAAKNGSASIPIYYGDGYHCDAAALESLAVGNPAQSMSGELIRGTVRTFWLKRPAKIRDADHVEFGHIYVFTDGCGAFDIANCGTVKIASITVAPWGDAADPRMENGRFHERNDWRR